MKILFICGPLDYGGAGKIIKFVANDLVKRGWKVSIFSLREKNRSQDLDPKIVFYGKDGSSDKKVKWLNWRLDEMVKIRDIVKLESPSIVCTFVSDNAVMARIATLGLNGFKFVSAERGDPYTLPKKWQTLVKWAYSKSDNCIFQLKKQGDFFGKSVMARSFVIPNPYIPLCDIPVYRGKRKNTIVTAGRFEYQKGFDVLIKAFAKVHERHPNISLIIYGSGPLLDEYKALAKSLHIEEFIQYPGYIKNVAESVQQEGIFVLPSRFEGIPNALIEALSTGIPTVSADCSPGGPEFLTEGGKRGLLVDVDDVDGTADAICKLIENSSLYAELCEKGPEVIKALEPSLISKMWNKTFENILGQ